MSKFLYFLYLSLVAPIAYSEVLPAYYGDNGYYKYWMPDGKIKSITSSDGKIFLGGDFQAIKAPRLGPLGPLLLNLDTGQAADSVANVPYMGLFSLPATDGKDGFYVYSLETDSGIYSPAHILANGKRNTSFDSLVEGDTVSLDISSDKQTLYVLASVVNNNESKTLLIIDINTQSITKLADFPLHGINPYTIKVSPNNQQFLVHGSENNNNILALFDIDSSSITLRWKTVLFLSSGKDNSGSLWKILFSPSGSAIYVSGRFARIANTIHQNIVAFDAVTGTVLPFHVDISASGRVPDFAILNQSQKLYLLANYFESLDKIFEVDLSTGKILNQFLSEEQADYTAITASKDEQHLYVSGRGNGYVASVRRIEISSGTYKTYNPHGESWRGGFPSQIMLNDTESHLYISNPPDNIGAKPVKYISALDEDTLYPIDWTPELPGPVDVMKAVEKHNILLVSGKIANDDPKREFSDYYLASVSMNLDTKVLWLIKYLGYDEKNILVATDTGEIFLNEYSTIKKLDINSGDINTVILHQDYSNDVVYETIEHATISSDGKKIFAVSRRQDDHDYVILAYDIKTASIINSYQLRDETETYSCIIVRQILYSKIDNTLIVYFNHNEILFLDADTLAEKNRFKLDINAEKIQLSSDQKRLSAFSYYQDQSMKDIDILSGSIIYEASYNMINRYPDIYSITGNNKYRVFYTSGRLRSDIRLFYEPFEFSQSRVKIINESKIIKPGNSYVDADPIIELVCASNATKNCEHILYSMNQSWRLNKMQTYHQPIQLKSGDSIFYLSIDDEGNYEPIQKVKFVTDKKAPETMPGLPSGTYKDSVILTLNCKDDGSGCAHIYFTIDGSEPNINDGELHFYEPNDNLEEGTYSFNHNVWVIPISAKLTESTTVNYFSIDNAGRQEVTKQVEYIIEETKNKGGLLAVSYWSLVLLIILIAVRIFTERR